MLRWCVHSLAVAGSTQHQKVALFGQGIGPIWLASVAYTGSESTLSECSHHDDAGVKTRWKKKVILISLGHSVMNTDSINLIGFILLCVIKSLVFISKLIIYVITFKDKRESLSMQFTLRES